MDAARADVRTAELLQHSEWVRRLARRLLADAAAADDLAQETLLAAWRRPAARGRALKPWLASIARNAARQSARSESARRAREELAARPDALPDASEVLQRLELQRELVESVRALDEPYRSTILLRYMEGLSCARIARRQGVPAATVRSRLERGLDELRRRAIARSGDDRGAFAIGMCALASPQPAGAASIWILGGLAMQTATQVTLAAAVAVIAAGWWLVSRADRRDASESSLAAVAPAPEAERESSSQRALSNARSAVDGVDETARDARLSEPPVAEPAAMPELERTRDSVRRAAEGMLAGELDAGVFLDAALLLVRLEIDAGAPILRDGAETRYALAGAAEGMQADFVVNETTNASYAKQNASISIRLAPAEQPEVAQSTGPRAAEARIGILHDAQGKARSFYVRTSVGPDPDPRADHARFQPEMLLYGMRYGLDLDRPFDGRMQADGMRLLSGAPEAGTFTSGSWEAPMTLVGGTWPRIEDIERLSDALMERLRSLE